MKGLIILLTCSTLLLLFGCFGVAEMNDTRAQSLSLIENVSEKVLSVDLGQKEYVTIYLEETINGKPYVFSISKLMVAEKLPDGVAAFSVRTDETFNSNLLELNSAVRIVKDGEELDEVALVPSEDCLTVSKPSILEFEVSACIYLT